MRGWRKIRERERREVESILSTWFRYGLEIKEGSLRAAALLAEADLHRRFPAERFMVQPYFDPRNPTHVHIDVTRVPTMVLVTITKAAT